MEDTILKQKKYGKRIFSVFLASLTLSLTSCLTPSSSTEDLEYQTYLKAVSDGFNGTFEEWLLSLTSQSSSESSSAPSSEPPTEGIYHTVIFDSAGGSFVSEQIIEHNTKVSEPFVYKLGYTLAGWYLNDEQWEFAESVVTENTILEARWTQDKVPPISNLPLVDIDLKGEQLANVNRQDYVESAISLTNSFGNDDITSVPALFRGRGNSSWNYEKKGYRIKFDKKQALFGLPKSKHWVLVPGSHDHSLIRSNLAYTITKDVLDNIEYQTSVNEVNLYVNGEYRGIYSLFEQIRVDEDRVNIKSEYGKLDTGYLIEYDAYATSDGGENGINYFPINGLKYPFKISSPDPDDYLEEGISEEEYRAQVSFIQDYVQQVVDAVLNEDFETFSRLADVPSFIDTYLIHELFKNTDTGWSSLYFYKKPNGKLYSGPVWDFDISSGISRGDSSYAGIYVGAGIAIDSPKNANELFISLMKQDEFVTLFKERFTNKKDEILTSINNYELKIKAFEESYIFDAKRWSDGSPAWFIEQRKVFKWLRDRIEWLTLWANES